MTDYTTTEAAQPVQRACAAFRMIMHAALWAETGASDDERLVMLALIRTLAVIGHEALTGAEADLAAETAARIAAQRDPRELAQMYLEHIGPFTARVAAELGRIAAQRAARVGPGRKHGPADAAVIRAALEYYEQHKPYVTLEAAAREHYVSARTLKRYRRRARAT